MLLFLGNLLLTFIPLLILALLKLIPGQAWKNKCTFWLHVITTTWMKNNLIGLKFFAPIKLEISGDDLSKLKRKDWYLVISNHQSWMDIVVLYQIFLGKIPFMKFFLKEQLRYVPILGLAWWALDFPFMKRYSKSYIMKHPEKAGKDVEATKKACAKFKKRPISIVNFMEGTRFTEEKKKKLDLKYDNLLAPKAGGAAYVLGILGEQMKTVLDVTISYSSAENSFWDALCGRLKSAKVHVNVIKVRDDLIGDYSDQEYRKHFIGWVNNLWEQKDKQLTKLKKH
jgi:1-acyl-sn-glycerol-3-phosphate acyltransferase